ncbi:Sulfatase family protein [Sphingopyxis sp. LC81]|uniref:sulfatase family protein n=1 Tax=Sphingopyxis sp. LC81 TaxID=1502850 RepID=UPI00050E7501|nr:sulfatase [Sphingopyxis sp. LC81]KGB54494.1 Sulfatase family protein [Sphingopyxis sp. LC81]
MKRIFKILGLVLALPLACILGLLLYAGYQIWANKPSDDADRIASKSSYLKTVASRAADRVDAPRPNVVIIFYDDLGYGDFGFTGSKAIRTPNIDALARDGVVLSNFHSASPVCSPSRAALMTGRLPPRAAVPEVLFPSDSPIRLALYAGGNANHLPAEEVTIAEVLKADGYRTGMIGKWHLGDHAPYLPNQFGFDSFYGAHYSNDMKPFAIYRNDKVAVAAPADQTRIDALYTGEAISFIQKSATDKAPFFLYFAHNFPHQPLAVPKDKAGRSAAGLYGDVVEGLDDGVGKIVGALKASGQLDNSIVILTSDNGPWYQGSPGQARGRKGQSFAGGTHVPFIIHWPKGIPGKRAIPAMAMGTDILPSLFDWIGLPLPQDRMIDGASLRPLLDGKSDKAHDFTYFYAGKRLAAVSDGRFKYFAKQPYIYATSNSRLAIASQEGPWLFDLSVDPDESYNVAMKYPDAVRRLKAALEARNANMAGNPRGWVRRAE